MAKTRASRPAEKLAIHGGEPVKTTPYGSAPKHDLGEWQAIRPIFERGTIPMAHGPEIMKLRQAFCKRFGMKHAVTTSSGTAALHTAVGALHVGRGDEVITSPITDMGTAVAILQQNAVPIFADLDPLTLMITPETVAARITPRTKAVIVVHLDGQAADVPGIMRVARRHKLSVVEDMAQSYLARIGDQYAGTFGHVGCWSLNESKHIGAGDGGVLLTNVRKVARRAELFADKCYDRESGKIDPFFAPYNYRLTCLVAGVALAQLKKLRGICSARHRHGTRLDRALAKIEGVTPRPVPPGHYATYWYYTFHVDPDILGCTAEQFRDALAAEGIAGLATIKQWRSLLEWTIFKDHRQDPHACAEHCPLYEGPTPDYDVAGFPGLRRAQRTGIRMWLKEYHTSQDVQDTIQAVRKVATHFRDRNRS